MAQHEERLFIILDEILNWDKAERLLSFPSKNYFTLPVAGLVATHDLNPGELANTIPTITGVLAIMDDDIAYDYKLKPGISQNMNASILLEKMKLV